MRNAVVIALVAVIAVVIVDRCHRSEQSEWEARVERVQEQVRSERARTEEAKQEAAAAVARADGLADSLRNRDPEIRERVVRIEEETPEGLRDHPAILSRDSVITDLREDVQGWQRAYAEQASATDALRGALERVEASRDSLLSVVEGRPGDRPWYIPRLGIGPYAGLCTDGLPCAGAGATLSWEIHL